MGAHTQEQNHHAIKDTGISFEWMGLTQDYQPPYSSKKLIQAHQKNNPKTNGFKTVSQQKLNNINLVLHPNEVQHY